jgi:hypothetical protein
VSRFIEVEIQEEQWTELLALSERSEQSIQEWVRDLLLRSVAIPEDHLMDERFESIRRAAKHSFPTADIEVMNQEIAEGYRIGLSGL